MTTEPLPPWSHDEKTDGLWALPKVTRVTIVGPNGMVSETWNLADVSISIQDSGRTLKVFYK